MGPQGLSSKIEILPHGIELITNTGVDGIRANSLLGDVTLETLGGSIKETSLLSAFELDKTGQAQMQGLLGEVSIKSSGKIKIQGLIITLKEFMEEIIDIVADHQHPSGSGPTGIPMPPASIKLNLLKKLKVGQSFE